MNPLFSDIYYIDKVLTITLIIDTSLDKEHV